MTTINPHIGVDIDTFVEKNMRLIHSIAQRFIKRLNHTSFVYDDLVSMASMGFTKAYNKFDPTKYFNSEGKGVKFSTYAVPKMIGEIQRRLRDENYGAYYPRSIKELAIKIWKEELVDLPPEEILDKLKGTKFNKRVVALKDIKDALEYSFYGTPCSSNEVVFEDSDKNKTTLEDTLWMSTQGDYSTSLVEDFLSRINPRLRKVVELTMSDRTQFQIGELIGTSQVQVSRLLKKAGELYMEYLNDKSNESRKLTRIEQLMQDYAAREVAVTTEEEVNTVTKGDVNTTKKLLAETTLGYREISKITGCTLNTISDLAKEHRPAEIRKAANPFVKQEKTHDDLTITDINGTELRVKNKNELEAVRLLKETRMSYSEISKSTNTLYARVAYFGPKFRSEELRRELQIEHGRKGGSAAARMTAPAVGNRDLAVQMMIEGGWTYKEIESRTGVPAGSLTKLRKNYEAGRYQWEKEPIKTIHIKTDEDKPVVAAARPTEPKIPAKTIAEAVEEFKQDIRKEVEEEMKSNGPTFTTAVEPHVEVINIPTQNPAVAEFEATPKAPRKIRRKMTVEADGIEITAAEALAEVEDIYNMLKNMNGNKIVSFEIKVHA